MNRAYFRTLLVHNNIDSYWLTINSKKISYTLTQYQTFFQYLLLSFALFENDTIKYKKQICTLTTTVYKHHTFYQYGLHAWKHFLYWCLRQNSIQCVWECCPNYERIMTFTIKHSVYYIDSRLPLGSYNYTGNISWWCNMEQTCTWA